MEFRILGPLEVRVGGRPLDLGGVRQRSLLAKLLLHAGEVVSSDVLAEELWGRAASGPKALQVAVSRLRHTLGDGAGALVTRPPGYELRLEPGQLDLHRFESNVAAGRRALEAGDAATAARELTEGLALWRGPALADLAYEPFAQEAIQRLEDAREGALEDRIAAELELGRHAECAAELRALVRQHPLRERLRELLMLALYRSGRQADALAAYSEARRALVEELGIEPGAGLQDLHARVLDQDPSLAIAPSPPDQAVVQPPDEELIGREPEVAELRAALEEALAGRGRVVLLSGDAGIGKSRLLEALGRAGASRGATVLWGRCWEAGGAPAYWPWVQSLRAYVRSRGPETLREELAGLGPEVAELLPELRDHVAAPGADAAPDAEGARFRLFASVASFVLAAAADRPIVLVLDDLHAADEPSLLMLAFLAGEISSAPVLVAGSYRDAELEANAGLAARMAEVARERGTTKLRLSGLSAEGVGRLIEESTGLRAPPRSVAAIHSGTEGNPLFVGEVARLLASEGRLDDADLASALPLAPGVRAVIGRRLQGLSEPALGTLARAAVIGREFDFDTLTALTGGSRDEALEALDEALQARVVTDVPGAPGRMRFAHALIRDTLYAELGGPRRLRLHREVGEALEQAYAADPAPHHAELAHHFAAARVPERARHHARGAGERAVRLFAYEEAIRLFELAYAAGPGADDEARGHLLLAIADAHARAGHAEQAKAKYLAAAELAREARLPEVLARAAGGYGGRFLWSRAITDEHLVPLLEDGLAALDEGDSVLRVELLSRLAAAKRGDPSRERREELCQEALRSARRLGDPATLALALDAAEAALYGPHTMAQRWKDATELVAIARAAGDRERLFDGHDHGFWAAWLDGRPERRATELAEMRAIAEELKQPAQRWVVAEADALLALMEGRLAEAAELIEAAASLGRGVQLWESTAAHKRQRFVLRRFQGRLEGFDLEVRDSLEDFPSPLAHGAVLAYVCARTGDSAEARAVLDGLGRHDLEHWHVGEEWLFSIATLAEACALLGDVDAAARLYDLLLPYADQNAMSPVDGGIDSVSRPLGLLATLLRRFDDAERHFDKAIRMNARMSAWPWLALAEEELARMLALRAEPGDCDRAGELAGRARTAYARLGMDAFEAGAAELERTLGAAPAA